MLSPHRTDGAEARGQLPTAILHPRYVRFSVQFDF